MSNADNRIEATLPAANTEAVVTAIATIKTQRPFGVDLSPEEKRAMLKLGGKSLDFVPKALEVATQNPDFLPRSFNIDEMRQDGAAASGRRCVHNREFHRGSSRPHCLFS